MKQKRNKNNSSAPKGKINSKVVHVRAGSLIAVEEDYYVRVIKDYEERVSNSEIPSWIRGMY